jgi:hypothetical protein
VLSAERGLRGLVEGNKRFVAGEARFLTVCKDTQAQERIKSMKQIR